MNSKIPAFKVLFLPLLIEQLFQLLLGQVDVLMLSQYADDSVAAVGLANQIIVLITMIYGFIHLGTTIQLTQVSSTGNKHLGAKIVLHAWLLNFLFTLLLTTVVFLFGDVFLQWLNTPKELMEEATMYVKVIAVGFIFHSMMGLVSAMLRSYSMVKFVMMATISTNIMNIVFNYLVLFTPVSILGEGVFGIAVATNLSRLFGAIMLIVYLNRHKRELFAKVNWLAFDYKALKRILFLGIPSAGEHVSYNFSQTIITSFIATFGVTTVSAKIYTQTITSVVFACSLAISQTIQLIVGKMLGIKLYEAAYQFSIRLLLRSIIFSTVFTFIVALLSFFIVPLLTDNEDIKQLTIQLIFLSVLLEPARTANIILISQLNVAGDVRYPVFISIVIIWLFVIPASYLFGISLELKLIGIWIVFIMDEWARALLLFLRWKKGNWRKISVLVDE